VWLMSVGNFLAHLRSSLGGGHTALSPIPVKASHLRPVLGGTAEMEGRAALTEYSAIEPKRSFATLTGYSGQPLGEGIRRV